MSVYVQKNPKDLRSQVDLAQLQEKQGALDQARATYEAILREDPNQEKILLRLIALLEKSHDKAALRTNHQRLVKLDPKNKVAKFNLGVLGRRASRLGWHVHQHSQGDSRHPGRSPQSAAG